MYNSDSYFLPKSQYFSRTPYLFSGGVGSVGATMAGALLLAMVFNILNLENGLGVISLSAYWQSVIRGAFLLVVVVLQAKLASARQNP